MKSASATTRKRGLSLPLHASLAWMLGTFAAFLLIGQTGLVRDLWSLSVYVLSAAGALWLGYWLAARRHIRVQLAPEESAEQLRGIVRLTRASAIYMAVYGLTLLAVYGATGPSDIIHALLNPGTAYLSKFDVYQQQQTESSNPLIQLLTLAAVLYTPVVPLAVIYWRRLFLAVKVIVTVGIGAYASFFLFIGTTKGLGDLALFALVGFLVVAARRRAVVGRALSRKVAIPLVLIGLAFSGYMAYNQSDRLTAVGGLSGKFQPSPVVEALVGRDLARGVSVAAFYPTHGYVGLAYDLDTEFVWSEMRGGSRAIDSYLAQYGFGESLAQTTYPYRAQLRTGWPADMYWSTAYPWLASDLTFPGVIVLMFVLGWWLCRLWVEAAFERSVLALLLFAQLALFVAYIPANNQIGISRPTTVGFVTTILLYAGNRWSSRIRDRRRPERVNTSAGTRSLSASALR